jgi:hypothetical protein
MIASTHSLKKMMTWMSSNRLLLGVLFWSGGPSAHQTRNSPPTRSPIFIFLFAYYLLIICILSPWYSAARQVTRWSEAASSQLLRSGGRVSREAGTLAQRGAAKQRQLNGIFDDKYVKYLSSLQVISVYCDWIVSR